MKKFRVTVERHDEYEIELDEKVFDKEFIEHFKRYFFNYDSLEEHAEHLAQFQARLGEASAGFIEGYGYVKRNGKLPFSPLDFDKNGNKLPESKRRKAFQGANINIIDEENDIEVYVEEITE